MLGREASDFEVCEGKINKGEIWIKLKDQEKLLMETDVVISKLIERIKPIMDGGVDNIVEGCSADEKPIGSELAIIINRHNLIIIDHLKRLGRIIDNVAL